MSKLLALIVTIAALFLTPACGHSVVPVTQSLIAGDPGVRVIPHPGLPDARSAATRYVYVADRTAKALLVYPAGVRNPAPIRTVSFSVAPIGVATDAQGHVYVTLYDSNQVAVYNSGATQQLETYDSTAGINGPTGITVDSAGNLWVANRGSSAVMEYAPGGSKSVLAHIPLPFFLVAGIAVAPNGDLFADVMGSQGGFVLRYPAGSNQYDHQHILGTAGDGGVTFDARGLLEIGTIANILTFNVQDWRRRGFAYYGEGATIHLMTTDANGNEYVPIESRTKPEVLVVPGRSADAPHALTKGLSLPSGAAAGI